MHFFFSIYRGYCSQASRDWPQVWALRMDIPLAFLLVGIVYALVSYAITANWKFTYDPGAALWEREIVAEWLLSLALVIAGAGLVLWVTSVIRSLPLPNAPRLKHHPDA